jgi:molybdopterin-containing oxidoreductase family molybdopterin binding subunit
MCFNRCGILAHKVDGVVVEVKGNPASSVGSGTICGKGAAGIMQLYDPNRITKPLRRTNPKKGLDQDPGWEEISWDEAYSIINEKFSYAASFGPTGLAMTTLVGNNCAIPLLLVCLSSMYGGAQFFDADICGAGIHPTADIYNGHGNSQPDYQYCRYLVQFGTQAGTTTRHGSNISAKLFAVSREEGCKLVSFDPHMSGGADKSDRWIPIRPGTDAAAALAMAYVLVHELDLIDHEYLKERTNSPALIIDATGRTLRDAASSKALYMDLSDNTPKTYDDPNLKDPALEGSFEVDGVAVTTAFSLYKKNLEKYTPESQESITTVPASIIRTVAKEFGEAATIGATIEIDGYTLPHRPACADLFSGVSRHKHSTLNNWAIYQLNVLVGSCNNVGGLIGFAPVSKGYTESSTAVWGPTIWEEDGFITASGMSVIVPHNLYEEVRALDPTPTELGMLSLAPYAIDPHFAFINQSRPEYYNNLFEPCKVMFAYACNPIKWWGNHDEMADMYRSFEYVVGMDLYLNDSSYFYDLFVPEASYLERYDINPNCSNSHHTPGAVGVDWSVDICQPVVESKDGAPSVFTLIAELADRSGTTPVLAATLQFAELIDEVHALPTDKKLTEEQVLDARLRSEVDDEHGLDWFKENGCYRVPRKVEEVYIWADGSPGRVPIYMEFMLEAKEKIEAKVAELGISWETDDFQPLADWKPCNHHEIEQEGYDIFPIYWTDAVNTDTWQVENAYISELNRNDRRASQVEMNAATAAAKGLADGDRVRITAPEGFAVEGELFLTEAIHPECCSVIIGSWGAMSSYIPLGKGVGVPVNHLCSGIDPKRLDHTSAAYDQCVRCKIEKI